MPNKITITVNGTQHALEVEPRTLLVHLIRETLNLTGTHIGCDTSFCGACTVLLNGASVKSCTVFAVQADQGEITTVESLASNGELHPIQQAFTVTGALQSGYSAGAQMLVTKALLERNPSPSEAEIRDALSGILDRETAYVKVIEAVQRAATLVNGDSVEPFRPIYVKPLTNGRDPVAYEPAPTVSGSFTIPKNWASRP